MCGMLSSLSLPSPPTQTPHVITHIPVPLLWGSRWDLPHTSTEFEPLSHDASEWQKGVVHCHSVSRQMYNHMDTAVVSTDPWASS